MYEIYDILTIEDKEYMIISNITINKIEYYYLNEIDSEEQLVNNFKIVELYEKELYEVDDEEIKEIFLEKLSLEYDEEEAK